MNNRHLLIVLVVVLLLGGGGTLFVLASGNGPVKTTEQAASLDAPADEVEPLDADAPRREKSAQQNRTDDAPLPLSDISEEGKRKQAERVQDSGGSGSGSGSSPTGGGGSSAPNGTTPNGGSANNPAGGKQANPPRKLTPAEREEARREATGRPALADKLGRTPGAVSKTNTLAKSPEQEKWQEQWYEEGITPPEMIPTPVHGKIMSQEAREGLAKATVGLISFFPLDGVAGGPLLPVITEFETDANGYFGGDMPASKLAPLNYPPVALTVTWEGHRIVAAMPIDVVDVGKANEFGIFWAPETPFTLKANAEQFDGDLSVVSTGELDPQRWHTAKRAATLAYFPAYAVAKETPEGEGPQKGYAEVLGTWDEKDAPYVSLVKDKQIVQTRRPARATIISTSSNPGSLPQPFSELVFENDALTPISGQVVDADGAAVANAVVTTMGDVLSQSAVTDAAGWFYLEDPPEKTNALLCVHDDFVEAQATPVLPGDSNVTITLAVRRPRIHLFVIDRITQAPLTDLSVQVVGITPWGKNAGKPKTPEYTQLTSADGNFLLEWEVSIKSITLEKIGYFPRTLQNPVALQETGNGVVNVELSPGRKLEIAPRNYTAAEDTSRWFPDPKAEDPGIYTAWSNHWIEYEQDFGDAPEEGEEGGSFDLLLGCTNHGIVDNEYEFKVDVYVDGVKKKTLTIMADSITERTARTSLGKLDGVHTIRLIWINDKWIPNQLDANIRYQSLKFLEQP
ncbi:MAG: carboxypeptidase regulatory-like domain-containing protein [Planctomycetes bacterium]|nr:carboxypeptidase regulatory-like domain-containing protein [Planctomycetota bacterium]